MLKQLTIFFAVLFSVFYSLVPLKAQPEQDPLLHYRASETRYFDLLHTHLEVSFDWEQERLLGKAMLTLKPYFFEQDKLILDAKSMDILKVKMDNEKLKFEYDSTYLKIDLGQPITKTDTIQIEIDYIANPNRITAKGNQAIRARKGLYFINPDKKESNKPQQIWTQGETEASSVWFPTIDQPNEKCTQEIHITVDNRFQTLSNGVLQNPNSKPDKSDKRTDIWKLDQPHSPYLFMMTIGEYSVIKDERGNIPLSFWVDPAYADDAKYIFGNTSEMMEYFGGLLEYPYPWSNYDQVVVRDFVSGAMENTTSSVFMEALQASKRELIDFNWDDIIAHELFHQWFGDLVTCESWSNLTLNEGMASYGEYLWNEYKYGRDHANYQLYLSQAEYMAEAHEETKSLIRYNYLSKDDMFDRHSYDKGASVFHMLRIYLGDEAFFAGLNLFLKNNAYQSVELADLRLAFEKTTGEDLNWFFDQWFFVPGHPVIDVTHDYKKGILTVTVKQYGSTGENHVYQLPLFIDITVSGKTQRHPVVLKNGVEIYEFELEEKPELVVFDADRQLLAYITHPKSEKELVLQMKNKEDIYGRLEALDSLSSFKSSKLSKEIISAGLSDPYDLIRQYTIQHLLDEKVKVSEYEKQLESLIRDKSSLVRAMTITYLGDMGFEKYKTHIKAALQDSSYMVVGAAINQLSTHNLSLEEEVFEELSSETNINILLSLSDYVNKKSPDFSNQWYDEKLKTIKKQDLYLFLQVYAEKLVSSPIDYQKTAIHPVYQIAGDQTQRFETKLSAYQILMLLSDLEGVEELLVDLRERETNEELIEWFNLN